jgi:hypothetical protein
MNEAAFLPVPWSVLCSISTPVVFVVPHLLNISERCNP